MPVLTDAYLRGSRRCSTTYLVWSPGDLFIPSKSLVATSLRR